MDVRSRSDHGPTASGEPCAEAIAWGAGAGLGDDGSPWSDEATCGGREGAASWAHAGHTSSSTQISSVGLVSRATTRAERPICFYYTAPRPTSTPNDRARQGKTHEAAFGAPRGRPCSGRRAAGPAIMPAPVFPKPWTG